MQISVTRGLVQLKRLEQRINKKISNLNTLITVEKRNSKHVKEGTLTKEEYRARAKAEWDSLNALIKLRKEIKDAVVHSNAVTKVEICGTQYTVAQAIDRKASIENFESDIIRRIASGFNSAISKSTMTNERVEADAQRLFGSSTDDKKSEINRVEMMKLYIDTNGYEIIDPLNFGTLRDTLEKDVNNFLSEVDQALSESNAVTMIEISKDPMTVE